MVGVGSVGVLMRSVWRSLGVGWVCWDGDGGGWMVEFWTSDIVYMLILIIIIIIIIIIISMSTVCLTQFSHKVD